MKHFLSIQKAHGLNVSAKYSWRTRGLKQMTSRRFLSSEPSKVKAKVHNPQTPPPPPAGTGIATTTWVVGTAFVGGFAFYFRDNISSFLFSKDSELYDEDALPENVKELMLGEPAPTLTREEQLQKGIKEVKDVIFQVESTILPRLYADASVNWEDVREKLVELLESDASSGYEDGSYGPVWVRLAWHNAGTYSKHTKAGGSEGAGMRFKNEGGWGANAGLDVARKTLEPIKNMFPQISYSDLWSFAGTVAIEEMGGPEVTKLWRPGRLDKTEEEHQEKPLPDGLLPDADGRDHKEDPQQHVRDIFYRMGFNDREIVALCGAHALGRCHTDRSGYYGPWTRAPTTFSNEYFRLLIEEKWTVKKFHKGGKWTGPEQYETPDGELMMLPADMSLVWDPKFKKQVEIYAKDEELFFNDFAKAWNKLQEVGVKKFDTWSKYFFG